VLAGIARDLGHPSDWPLTSDQRLELLAARAPRASEWAWHDMRRLQVDGPMQMPRFERAYPRFGRGYGRSRVEESGERRQRAEDAAWLVDLCGWSTRQLAHARYGDDSDGQRREVRRDIDLGRRCLAEDLVLPWVSWGSRSDGKPPEAWWARALFWEDFEIWCGQVQAATTPFGADAAQGLRLAVSEVGRAREELASARFLLRPRSIRPEDVKVLIRKMEEVDLALRRADVLLRRLRAQVDADR
jgi:hypothetical protein